MANAILECHHKSAGLKPVQNVTLEGALIAIAGKEGDVPNSHVIPQNVQKPIKNVRMPVKMVVLMVHVLLRPLLISQMIVEHGVMSIWAASAGLNNIHMTFFCI